LNELGENSGNEEGEGEAQESPWTIRLGKNVIYNPSPFRDRQSFRLSTLLAVVLIGGSLYLIFLWPGFLTYLFGGLAIGSMVSCYFLSFYETRLLDKKEKEKLR
jgi:hypothetical protein